MNNLFGTSRGKDSAAVQFMVLDILETLVTLSENPGRMGTYLAQQVRELVGARIVALLSPLGDHEGHLHTLVALEPARHAKPELQALLEDVAQLAHGYPTAVLWQGPDAPPAVQAILHKAGFNGVLVLPLMVGARSAGLLIILHLLDMQRNSETLRALEILSPIAALVIQNARFFEAQASIIQARSQDLRESERHFHTLAEIAPVGILHLGMQGEIFFLNERWKQLTGYSQPPPGRSVPLHVHEDDRAELKEKWDQLQQSGTPLLAEFRIDVPNHDLRWVHGEMVAERDEAGVITGFIGSLMDLTQRKKAEAEREHLETQLAQSQKLESLGRLAGGVAHDINNTLSAILAHAELLKFRLGSDHALQPHVAGIDQAVDRSRGIIQQLLAFSRKQVITPQVLEMNERIAETQRTLAPLIGEDVQLRFSPGEGLWRVRCDPTQLDQILVNLAVNARDAMPKGGCLDLETTNVMVDASWNGKPIGAAPGPYVCLSVSDEGCGMEPETLAHVFEPFFTTKGVGKGTGLGLATVFGIVSQSKGFIDVYSEPNVGTTFRIYLPAVQEASAQRMQPAPDEPLHGVGKIMVVEDDQILRDLIPFMLQGLGYEVLAASSPEEALSVCAQPGMTFDLLLTDVIMPGMSGRELRDRMLHLRPNIKVLFMSGYTADIIATRGVLEAGVNFLAKPFTMGELGKKVAEVMAQA
ncbi:MAG: response regulator [Holophaga sp.]|nr:response regulator [Holophaga sp.]